MRNFPLFPQKFWPTKHGKIWSRTLKQKISFDKKLLSTSFCAILRHLIVVALELTLRFEKIWWKDQICFIFTSDLHKKIYIKLRLDLNLALKRLKIHVRIFIWRFLTKILKQHCVKSVRIGNFSVPYFPVFGPEKLWIRTLFTLCKS